MRLKSRGIVISTEALIAWHVFFSFFTWECSHRTPEKSKFTRQNAVSLAKRKCIEFGGIVPGHSPENITVKIEAITKLVPMFASSLPSSRSEARNFRFSAELPHYYGPALTPRVIFLFAYRGNNYLLFTTSFILKRSGEYSSVGLEYPMKRLQFVRRIAS